MKYAHQNLEYFDFFGLKRWATKMAQQRDYKYGAIFLDRLKSRDVFDFQKQLFSAILFDLYTLIRNLNNSQSGINLSLKHGYTELLETDNLLSITADEIIEMFQKNRLCKFFNINMELVITPYYKELNNTQDNIIIKIKSKYVNPKYYNGNFVVFDIFLEKNSIYSYMNTYTKPNKIFANLDKYEDSAINTFKTYLIYKYTEKLLGYKEKPNSINRELYNMQKLEQYFNGLLAIENKFAINEALSFL